METISALLDIFAGNSPAPAQRPVTRSFDVFFDMRLNKRLIKQWWGWWFETLSPPLWRLYNTIWQWGRDIPGIAAVDATVLTPCQCRLMTENTNTRFSNIFQNHSADTAFGQAHSNNDALCLDGTFAAASPRSSCDVRYGQVCSDFLCLSQMSCRVDWKGSMKRHAEIDHNWIEFNILIECIHTYLLTKNDPRRIFYIFPIPTYVRLYWRQCFMKNRKWTMARYVR